MSVNTGGVNSIAPISNVAAMMQLADRMMNRRGSLPGLAVFYGPSGFGKSWAATFTANKVRAHHVQVKSVWTKKRLCQAILAELDIAPAKTICDMLDQISMELALSGRMLIVDEADFLVSRSMIEIIRDIYESSNAPIILIGEEMLPQKLKKWERVHGRVLEWTAAQPATAQDAGFLAKIYCPGVEICPELLADLNGQVNGSVRRLATNLDAMREAAQVQGWTQLDKAAWKSTGQTFSTGQPPKARRFAA